MRKNFKKLLAVAVICAFVLGSIPSFAATTTFYGHSITYSKTKLSSTRAQAVTTCSSAKYVSAKVTVQYNGAGGVTSRSGSNSSVAATTAIVDISNTGSSILTILGHHEAEVTYNGALKYFSVDA